MRSRSIPSTPDRCRLLLTHWRSNLSLSNLEKEQLAGELKALDQQLERLKRKNIRISVFGRVGVGKSSLLNALLGQKQFPTDVAHGFTRRAKSVLWNQPINHLRAIELIDTPGIDEIKASNRTRLATRVALQSDLVMVVLDSDLTNIELEALKSLLSSKKPVVLVLNRCDQWSLKEQKELIQSIRNRLPNEAHHLEIQVAASSPRKAQVKGDGRIRSTACVPIIDTLRNSLIKLLSNQGDLLLSLNALHRAESFYESLKKMRLKRSKSAAQGLIGRFAALKASGVAANPLVMLDLAGGLACDTALIVQLSKLYGLQMGGRSARELLKKISLYNTLLGGAQLGIQLALGVLRQLLVLGSPLTNGLSLASAAPVALAQAALAVHTTKLTGRLAAKELLKGSQRREPQPSALLKRLASSDPEVQRLIGDWQDSRTKEPQQLPALLP